jgi:hypothetical protein
MHCGQNKELLVVHKVNLRLLKVTEVATDDFLQAADISNLKTHCSLHVKALLVNLRTLHPELFFQNVFSEMFINLHFIL